MHIIDVLMALRVAHPFRSRWPSTAIALVVLAAGAGRLHGQTIAPEYRLKAAFVSKIPQFVSWPATTRQDRVTICVARPDPFGSALGALVDAESINGRPMTVRQLDPAAALEDCGLLFVPAATRDRKQWLQRAARFPILTVGESRDFLDLDGMVNLRIVSGRVRFDINLPATHRAGLQISSQLLRLALSVRGDPS